MQTEGRITKGIAGFYYVCTPSGDLYECKAKGSLRRDAARPLVGDFVQIAIVDEQERKGNIEMILPRKNCLVRPAVANVDQALVIFALKDPEPNFRLLDTFLARMELTGIPSILCFNKTDLDPDCTRADQIRGIYKNSGYPILFTNAQSGGGVDALMSHMKGKCTTVAGPSGVGKSSLINLMQRGIQMETGSISEKTARGRHTTRHSELIPLAQGAFILDTPGFTSLTVDEYDKEDIVKGFQEIYQWKDGCRFAGCSHIQEPDCLVKKKLAAGEISPMRYESYVAMYEKCKEKRRY